MIFTTLLLSSTMGMPIVDTTCPSSCTGNPVERCYFSPSCTDPTLHDPKGGLGCNAGGHPNCRFCAFGPFDSWSCDGTPIVEAPASIPVTVEPAGLEHIEERMHTVLALSAGLDAQLVELSAALRELQPPTPVAASSPVPPSPRTLPAPASYESSPPPLSPPAPPLPNPYFLAPGGKSCTDACAAIDEDYVCDTDLITAAAANVGACKAVLDSLAVEYERSGMYPDDDSGCTYHPGQDGWAQVMHSGRDDGTDPAPTCDEDNADASRQRVCACSVVQTLTVAPLASATPPHNATSP